jgi:hypothetical protein
MQVNCSQSRCPGLHLAPLAGRGRIASAIRVRGSLRERGDNRFEHPRHVEENVVIPESQQAIIAFDEPFIADPVVRATRRRPLARFVFVSLAPRMRHAPLTRIASDDASHRRVQSDLSPHAGRG